MRVFDNWFRLADETFLRPTRQPEPHALQAAAPAARRHATGLSAAHAAARAARAPGARGGVRGPAAAAWAAAWAAQLARRAARGRTAAQLSFCAAELAAGTAVVCGLSSGTALQVHGCVGV